MKKKNIELPEYAKMKDSSTVLRLTNNRNGERIYFKDAGGWGVGINIKENKIFSTHNFKNLNDVELIKATKREWFIDNEQWIDNKLMLLDKDDLFDLLRSFIKEKNLKHQFVEYGLTTTDYTKSELEKSFNKKFED